MYNFLSSNYYSKNLNFISVTFADLDEPFFKQAANTHNFKNINKSFIKFYLGRQNFNIYLNYDATLFLWKRTFLFYKNLSYGDRFLVKGYNEELFTNAKKKAYQNFVVLNFYKFPLNFNYTEIKRGKNKKADFSFFFSLLHHPLFKHASFFWYLKELPYKVLYQTGFFSFFSYFESYRRSLEDLFDNSYFVNKGISNNMLQYILYEIGKVQWFLPPSAVCFFSYDTMDKNDLYKFFTMWGIPVISFVRPTENVINVDYPLPLVEHKNELFLLYLTSLNQII